jgi:hypothetical protein
MMRFYTDLIVAECIVGEEVVKPKYLWHDKEYYERVLRDNGLPG